MATRWTMNKSACCIDPKYEGMREVIALNLDKAFLYSRDSKTLNHFRDDMAIASTKETWEILYYSYLYLVERMATQFKKPPEKKAEDPNSQQMKKKNEKKKKQKKKQRAVDIMEDEAEEDEEEDEDEGEEKDKEEKPDGEEEHVARRKIDFFLEPVLKRKKDENSADHEVSDYRYWFGVYDGGVSINKVWEEIVTESIEYNDRLKAGKKRKFESEPKPYEKWKMINSRAKLAEIMDNRLGGRYATEVLHRVESLPLSDPNNPVCATKLFSPYLALSKDTNQSADRYQSVWNFPQYVKRMQDGSMTLKFPRRKLVIRVPISDMEVMELMSKYMPDHQEMVQNQLIKMLPIIIRDDSLAKDFSNLTLSEFFDQKDPNEKEVDEEVIDLDDLFAKKGDNAKKKKAGGSFMTRGEVASSLADEWGFGDLNMRNMKPFDRTQTTRRADKLIAQLLKVPGIDSHLTNVYASIKARTSRNSFKIREDLQNVQRSKYWSQLVNPKLVARKLHVMNKEAALHDYMSLCRIGANLSPTGKIIMEAITKEKLYTGPRMSEGKFDKRFTSFCTQELSRFAQWENVYLVNSAHVLLDLGWKNGNDSTNMDLSRIHQHMITYGPAGGEGKSYVWQVLAKHLRIEKTTEMLTYESLRSRATDESNMNDNVVIFDEIEREMMDKDAGSSDKERAFKLLLSSNTVSAKLLHIDEDGNRTTKKTYSECITVFFGSTNSDPLKMMSSAMKRRWHIGFFNETLGANRAIIDLQLASLIMSEEEKAYREKLDRHYHLIQALVFEIEKLIYCGALTDVSMHTSVIIFSYISHEMTRAGKPQPSPSMFDRIRVLARFNCILDAIDTTFFTPCSKYVGQPIQIEHFRSLDRKLFCTSEHVVSAIGECVDLLISPAEHVIKRALKRVWEEKMVDLKRNSFMQTGKNVDIMVEGKPTGNYKRVFDVDWNYIRFALSGQGLAYVAQKVSDVIPRLKNPTSAFKYSKEVVLGVLESWMNRSMMSKSYVEGKLPLVPVIDDSSENESAVIAMKSETTLWIHYGFISMKEDTTPADFLERVIKDIFTRKYQLPHYFPWVPEERKPHIRKILAVPGETVRDVDVGGGRTIRDSPVINLPSFVSMSSMDMKILRNIGQYSGTMRSVSDLTIMTDLDSWANQHRNDTLFIDSQKIDPASLKDNPMEALAERIKNRMPDTGGGVSYTVREMLAKPPEQEPHIKFSRIGGWLSEEAEAGAGEEEEGEEEEEVDLSVDVEDEDFYAAYNRPQDNEKVEDGKTHKDDADYDSQVGYFMGTSLNNIFADDSKGLESLDEESVRTMYSRLDAYDEETILDDYDFDKEEFLIRVEADGRKVYHWDIMAESEASDHGKRKEDCSYQFLGEEDLKGLSHDEIKALRKKVDGRNMAQYKLTCYHPLVVYSFEEAKLYSLKDSEYWGRYPDDMKMNSDMSRQERWKNASNIILNDATMFAMAKNMSHNHPEYKKLIDSEYTPGGGFRRRDISSPLNTAQNALSSLLVPNFKKDDELSKIKMNFPSPPVVHLTTVVEDLVDDSSSTFDGADDRMYDELEEVLSMPCEPDPIAMCEDVDVMDLTKQLPLLLDNTRIVQNVS